MPAASDRLYELLGKTSPDDFFFLMEQVTGTLGSRHHEWTSYLSGMLDKAVRNPEKTELYMSQAMGHLEGTLARAKLKNYIAENEPLMNTSDGEILGWALVQLKM